MLKIYFWEPLYLISSQIVDVQYTWTIVVYIRIVFLVDFTQTDDMLTFKYNGLDGEKYFSFCVSDDYPGKILIFIL